MPTSQQFGTLTTLDTLAANRTLIADYGEDKAYEAFAAILDAHNKIMEEMVGSLVTVSGDRLQRFGGAATGEMIEVDEFGTADAQKVTAGSNVGFPLSLFQYSVQWTRKYLQNKTMADMAAQIKGATVAHRKAVQRKIKQAIFTPTNNLNYLDKLVDNLKLEVRAFVNADSADIPPDPYGNAFNSASHTHYLATASFIAGNLSALLATVKEHYNEGNIIVIINQAQEATVKAFTGFTAYVDQRIVQPQTATYAMNPSGQGLNMMETYNRAIGVYDAAEIWVKPWCPVNYVFCYNPQQTKPLVLRTRSGQFNGLTIAAELESFPLHAQFLEDEFGVSVKERTNGAVLYTGGGSYVNPTL